MIKYNKEKFKALIDTYFAEHDKEKGCINDFLRWARKKYGESIELPSKAWFRNHFDADFKQHQEVAGQWAAEIIANDDECKSLASFLKKNIAHYGSLDAVTHFEPFMSSYKYRYKILERKYEGFYSELFDYIASCIEDVATKDEVDTFYDELLFNRISNEKKQKEEVEKQERLDIARKRHKELLADYEKSKKQKAPIKSDPLVKWADCPSVYILYDKGHKPLYVGKSTKLSKRIANHIETQPFSNQIHSVGIKQYPTEADMDIAEIVTIQTLSPEHNKDCNRDNFPQIMQVTGDVDEVEVFYDDLPAVVKTLHHRKMILAKHCEDSPWHNKTQLWEAICRGTSWIEFKQEKHHLKLFAKGEMYGELGEVCFDDRMELEDMWKRGDFLNFSQLHVSMVDPACIGNENMLFYVG